MAVCSNHTFPFKDFLNFLEVYNSVVEFTSDKRTVNGSIPFKPNGKQQIKSINATFT